MHYQNVLPFFQLSNSNKLRRWISRRETRKSLSREWRKLLPVGKENAPTKLHTNLILGRAFSLSLSLSLSQKSSQWTLLTHEHTTDTHELEEYGVLGYLQDHRFVIASRHVLRSLHLLSLRSNLRRTPIQDSVGLLTPGIVLARFDQLSSSNRISS